MTCIATQGRRHAFNGFDPSLPRAFAKTSADQPGPKSGRKVSKIMRDAVDAAIAGVTLEEIYTLDMGIHRAQGGISAMLADLKDNTPEHTAFMHEIDKLQKAAAKESA